MKKEVKPRFKPSQRMKKRYILFTCKKGSFSSVKHHLFSLGIKPLKLIEFDPSSKKGIVRCSREKANALKKAMVEAGFKTVKTSGSLKKLRSIA